MTARRLSSAFAALVAFCILFVVTTRAWAFTPPPIEGPITDPAGKLSDADKQTLDQKLRDYKDRSGNEITFFIAPSLNGEEISDVAYDTARAWKAGTKKTDNDALVVIAPNERKIYIETAKGAGGGLPDLAAYNIVENTMAPRMRQNDFRGAISDGSDAIIQALGDAAAGKTPTTGGGAPSLSSVITIIIIMLLIIFFLAKRGGGGRGGGSGFFWFGGGGGGGFGGGGGGGGSWGGGGGDWGGGGAGGSY